MATPKHKIFFGLVNNITNPLVAKNNTPPIFSEAPPPPADMDPPGPTWDSEIVKFDQSDVTMDAGYTTEQLIYLLSQ